MRLILLLLLVGCHLEPHQKPYCVIAYGDPSPIHGERQVMCICESGAEIPPVCGGGIAPTQGTYAP